MNPIRPNPPPIQPVTARPAGDARAAQRAFFDAALGKVDSAAAAAAPKPSAVKLTQIQTDAPAPQRILRPGSLIDIKV